MIQKLKLAVWVSLLALTIPLFQAQALDFPEQNDSGQVLGASTSAYPYPSGSLVNDGGTIYFIIGTAKVPFTSWQAFVGLGYSIKNVAKGSLVEYTPTQTYAINTPNTSHPYGSWLIYKGTVYYSTEQGLIGVPSAAIFASNGGKWSYIVKANGFDVAILKSNPNLPPLTNNDPRVSNQPTESTNQPSFTIGAVEGN